MLGYVDFVDIAMIHFVRTLHAGEGLDNFGRVGRETSDRLFDAKRKIMPAAFVNHDAMARRKDKAFDLIQVGHTASLLVIGLT